MNNKGFAITGILYTLFILFLLVLISVLAGMRSRRNMQELSIGRLEESYLGSDKNSTNYVTIANNKKIAPVDGKYEFEMTDPDNKKHTCYSYLKKGTSLDNINYVPNDCNVYKDITKTLKKIYSFEEE